MKRLLLIPYFALLFICVQAWGQTLDQFLDIDRLSYYSTDMAGNLRKKGFEDLAHALEKISPEDIWKFVKSDTELLAKIEDAHKYDSLLKAMVLQENPALESQISNVNSNYNFFKNKLNESYVFKEITNIEARAKILKPAVPTSYKIPKLDQTKLTLNADQYISNRQTRAIIWDAIKNGRDIEFYMEDFQTALAGIEARGGKVTAEVQTLANNYNKNYLVFYADENRYAHIVTDISGTDRLHHLTKQLSVISWNETTAAEKFSNKVNVFGPVKKITEHETERLVRLLEVLPKADHVIIGQKGAMERQIRLSQKVNAILELAASNPNAVNNLEAAEKALISELNETQDIFTSMKDASTWDKMFEKLKTKMAMLDETFSFNLDLNSHSIADVTMKSTDGKIKRIRLVSNVWGNESKPIADALVQTGHKKFTYIGTAGTLNSDFKVGDVVSPSQVQMADGKIYELAAPAYTPKGLKQGGNLTQVASLFDESEKWLSSQRAQGNNLVEMEVGYLAESFDQKPGVKLNVFLLVSDAVGEEGETLDQAGSSIRKKAQLSTLYEVMKYEKLESVVPPKPSAPGEVDNLVQELEPGRNALSIYQIKQKLKKEFDNVIPGKAKVRAMVDVTPSFTPALLQKRIEMTQKFLNDAYFIAQEKGKSFSAVVDGGLFDGTYHPKEKVKIRFLASSKLDYQLIEQLKSTNPDFKKYIDLEKVANAGGEVPVASGEIHKLDILRTYNETALAEGGLLGKISKAGNLSFSALEVRDSCKVFLNTVTGVVP